MVQDTSSICHRVLVDILRPGMIAVLLYQPTILSGTILILDQDTCASENLLAQNDDH